MSRIPRLGAAFAAALTVAALASAPAQAEYEPCPRGWTQVTAAPVGHVNTFCRRPPLAADLPAGADDLYFVKVNSGYVGQKYQFLDPFNSDTRPNPLFMKRTAASWLNLAQTGDRTIRMVINGAFFDTTLPGTNNTTIAFPFEDYWSSATGFSWLKTAAKVPTGDDITHRTCFGWGIDVRWASYGYLANDWAGVARAIDSCSTGGSARSIVALRHDWDFEFGAPNALTYVGNQLDSFGMPTNNQMCFLVGGYQRRDQVPDLFDDFGCTPIAQMDGGRSTNLIWVEDGGTTPTWSVNGYDQPGGLDRPVPHVFTIG